MSRASAFLAMAFGVVLALAEIARNWGNWQWWPFWLVDFIAAALLLGGAALVLRKNSCGTTVLCGAWGFTTAMFYMSFWSHIEHYQRSCRWQSCAESANSYYWGNVGGNYHRVCPCTALRSHALRLTRPATPRTSCAGLATLACAGGVITHSSIQRSNYDRSCFYWSS